MYETIKIDDELTLSQLKSDDADELFALVDANRTRLAEWLPWPDSTKSAEDSREFIKSVIERRQKGTVYGYGVLLNGKIIGHVSLMHVGDDNDKDPEIGYWIDEKHSSQGIATKVALALTSLGLETLKLDKVVIRADVNNAASNRVAEKAGYTNSGSKYHSESKRTFNRWVQSRT